MRIRKNSISEADALLVMRDRALELGYVWDVVNCPTPAWCLDIRNVKYNKPLFDIPAGVWEKEIVLWLCDCAERVLPIWEEWAIINRPVSVYVPRHTIHTVREYVHGRVNKEELRECKLATLYAFNAASYHNTYDGIYVPAALHAFAAAYNALYYATNKAVAYAADAVYAASNNFDHVDNEKEWQRAALARRIDAVAPWHL